MPLYEYKCLKCGRTFEILQKVDDEPVKTCINCGGPVKKLISPSAIKFKGQGWYINDYAKKSTKQKKKSVPVKKEKTAPKKNAE